MRGWRLPCTTAFGTVPELDISCCSRLHLLPGFVLMAICVLSDRALLAAALRLLQAPHAAGSSPSDAQAGRRAEGGPHDGAHGAEEGEAWREEGQALVDAFRATLPAEASAADGAGHAPAGHARAARPASCAEPHLRLAWAHLHERVYLPHVVLARQTFRQPAIRRRLNLDAPYPCRFGAWLEAARAFYRALLTDDELMIALAARGLGRDAVFDALAELQQLATQARRTAPDGGTWEHMIRQGCVERCALADWVAERYAKRRLAGFSSPLSSSSSAKPAAPSGRGGASWASVRQRSAHSFSSRPAES
jgi:hypothetical protein